MSFPPPAKLVVSSSFRCLVVLMAGVGSVALGYAQSKTDVNSTSPLVIYQRGVTAAQAGDLSGAR